MHTAQAGCNRLDRQQTVGRLRPSGTKTAAEPLDSAAVYRKAGLGYASSAKRLYAMTVASLSASWIYCAIVFFSPTSS